MPALKIFGQDLMTTPMNVLDERSSLRRWHTTIDLI